MFALKIIDIVDVGIKYRSDDDLSCQTFVSLSIKSFSNMWTQMFIDSSTAVEN